MININFINGHTNVTGGTIYSNGGETNIKNCIFKNSTSDNTGGVIYNNMGTLNIEDSTFTENRAFKYGGVLYTQGKTSVKNTEFTKNILTSDDSIGACIIAAGKIDFNDCLFSDCYAQYSAAGLLNYGNATLNHCRFERMCTNYTAGAISNHGHMLINNSYFGYNDVKYYAAAILDYAGEKTTAPGGPHVITKVYNTIFEKNHADYHGAVSNNFPNTYLFMQNCALIDNYLQLNQRYGDIALDDNATLQYCWWGSNEINPYYYSPHNGEIHPEKINASRWLVMKFTSNDGVIYKNDINRLTVNLKYYFDNETKEIREYTGEFDLPLEVTFFTNDGILATKKLVNGVATFDYNAKSAGAVYARINDQELKIDNYQLRKTSIIASDFEKYYGSSSKLSIKVVKQNNLPVSNEELTVSVDGITYTIKTDKNGIAKLTLENSPKKYTVKIYFYGEGYIGSSKSVKVKIIKPTIKASKLKIHKKGTFSVSFKDADKKAIKNVKVKFKIKGKSYIRTTDKNGVAKIKINLNPGKYTVKVGFKNTKYYGTTTLTKKITVIK